MKLKKNIEPKNPDTTTSDTDTSRTADRKTATAIWGGRESARKTNAFKWNG